MSNSIKSLIKAISEPCSADWQELKVVGTGVRLCECGARVYDARFRAELQASSFDKDFADSNLFLFYRRDDGTLATENCPIEHSRKSELKTKAVAYLTIAVLYVGTMHCFNIGNDQCTIVAFVFSVISLFAQFHLAPIRENSLSLRAWLRLTCLVAIPIAVFKLGIYANLCRQPVPLPIQPHIPCVDPRYDISNLIVAPESHIPNISNSLAWLVCVAAAALIAHKQMGLRRNLFEYKWLGLAIFSACIIAICKDIPQAGLGCSW